jgi:phytoene dehydrogenase-like protein
MEMPVFFYRDEAKTIDHLEAKFPGQGEAYARFLNDLATLHAPNQRLLLK